MQQPSFFVDSFGQEIFETKYAGTYQDPVSFYSALAKMIALGDEALEHQFRDMLLNRRFSPGGRILTFIGRPEARLSLMNCTTHAIQDDSLEAINQASMAIMRASSRGQGIGLDISALRPKDTPVNNAAKVSTGAISFMELLNSVGGTIGQLSRRAAMLFSISIDHPDVWRPGMQDVPCGRCGGSGCVTCGGQGFLPYDFLHVKHNPGRVENANISVMVTNKFFEAVKANRDWRLHFSGDTFQVEKFVPARELLRQIALSAWTSAEPGLQYWSEVLAKSNSDLFLGNRFGIVGTNACSEMPLDQEGVCNLGSINLAAYVTNPFTKEAEFNFSAMNRDVRLAVEFLDNCLSVELNHGYPISSLQRQSISFLRRVGLGVMGLADALAMMGLPYEADGETHLFLEMLFTQFRDTAYQASIDLAKRKGPALVWGASQDYRSSVIQGGFYNTLPDFLQKQILEHGTRNITLLSVAPTGTISNLLGVSGGVEPIFDYGFTRRTRIHGKDTFVEYLHPGVAQSRAAGQPDSIWTTAHQVSPKQHVAMQALVQRFIDESISKTVNLPASASVDDVEALYMQAWELGLKSVSIYRDGSRHEQVLYSHSEPESEACPECGEHSLTHSEGCTTCTSCGFAKCDL